MLQTTKRPLAVTFIGLVVSLAVLAGCKPKDPPQPLLGDKHWLFVASGGSATIPIFEAELGSNGLPNLVQQPGTGVPTGVGNASALKVVGESLYVAGSAGEIAQFTITPRTGVLTARATLPVGGPPHKMAATSRSLYVGNYSTNNLNAYAIDAAGELSALQTVPVDGINALETDTAGSFLFTGSRASGATSAQLCSHAIQPDGSLAATPTCVPLAGAPQAMKFANGVLFVMFNAIVAPSPGNTNWVSAWTVDATTGALTHRGVDLDIGAANAGGMAFSPNGQAIYIPRQGGFSTVSVSDPLTLGGVTFASTAGSQACQMPPAGAGEVLTDPRGKAIYLSDPIGVLTGNSQGPRLSAVEVDAAGTGMNSILCTFSGKIVSLALFVAQP